ncbi:hypothetical protein [uncultured Clostridium sp.]|uniref:hypothetical protein n=1 Tax=uncultured Clostridium sp. TaxID=59620 RepID=UPI0028EAAA26|nr:hypothetical protein [uncultured Clostridium sp.]
MNMNYYKQMDKWDNLTKALLILGVILLLSKFNRMIGIALIIYAIGRMGYYSKMNKNIGDINFNKVKSDMRSTLNNFKNKIKERKEFLITRCPNCSQKLRLPRKKGNILVTCPRCGYKFKLKT